MAVLFSDLQAAAEQDSDKVGDASVTLAWIIWANQAVESLWRLIIANFRAVY